MNCTMVCLHCDDMWLPDDWREKSDWFSCKACTSSMSQGNVCCEAGPSGFAKPGEKNVAFASPLVQDPLYVSQTVERFTRTVEEFSRVVKMFWKYNATSSAQLETLLSKEDVTLQEVMDSEEIINELRSQNKTFIDFLLKSEVIEELVTLTITEPPIELNEKTRFKYPNIASELLTCDLPAINERLASDKRLLEKLYTFIENDPPLNPLLASYFSKIMGALIARKTEQVLDFLKARDTFLPLLMKHLGTSAIMDLMLKLMTQVEGVEMRQNILNWLDSQRIIQQLISLLNPKIEKERHTNVAQLLCDFVRTSRDNQKNSTERADPDPLLNTLESPDTVCLLLNQIFDGEKCESSLIGGIQVLLALLDVHQNSIAKYNLANIYNTSISDEAVDMEQKRKIICNVTEAICTKMKDFNDLLQNPPKQPSIATTVGQLDPPLGNTRLQVVRLLAAIIPSSSSKLYDELESHSTFSVLLDLFFSYPWNNFLHTQVENCIVSGLKASVGPEFDEKVPSTLCKHLIVTCNLLERILKAWRDNDEQQAESKGIRQGYMGHLVSILNKILDMCTSMSLGQHLKDLKPETAKDLDTFKDTALAQVNTQQEQLLAGVHPNNSAEDSDDYGDIPYSQSSAMQQQVYTQYQMQHLTAQYIDVYSDMSDDAFNELQTIDNPSDVTFDLSENDKAHDDEIFKRMCEENINTLSESDDQIFEDKDYTFQTVIEKQGDKNDTVYSSDSDEGSPSGDDNMDVDPWTSPKPDPWSALASTTNENASPEWADFSSAKFHTSFTDNVKENTENNVVQNDGGVQIHHFNFKEATPEKSEEVTVKSAASGDHIVEQKAPEKNQDNSDKNQPSMSLEGDHQPLSSEPVQMDQSEKV